jgi:acyl-CoA dehydrogenase
MSIAKLLHNHVLAAATADAAHHLGMRMAAETGEWGTTAWGTATLSAPGLRIAGGTDEIQRNILAERVLQLPKDPPAPR